MQFYKQFAFCPRCGHRYGPEAFNVSDVAYLCNRCAYRFYQNSTPSSTAVIPASHCPAEILMLTRATEPDIGKLALPGGFLRYAEESSEGVKREVCEETLLDVTIDRLLCSSLVDYLYLGTRVSVLELAFLTRPVETDIRGLHTSEASRLGYYDVAELIDEPSRLAFPEHRRVLECYRECSLGPSRQIL